MKFDTAIVQTHIASPLGRIALAASERGLAGLWFTKDQRHLPSELAVNATRSTTVWRHVPDHPLLQCTCTQLAEYFAGERRDFDLPLDFSCGTLFQQTVWQSLCDIASGDTVSYGQISEKMGKPHAQRAVGGAIGRNPISIIVPCHRVIGASGALTGYGGGLVRKRALLRLEGIF